jgi:hypothetical protein
MIVDRHAPQDLFALVPQLVDDFEPELRELDRLLDDDELVRAIKAAMARRAPRSLTRGRRSTPVEVVLRLLVVKRLYGWSYTRVEHFVGDSLVLRQFCRVYLAPVPDATTLLRWAHLVGPAPLAALHERVVQLARALRVTRGRKLRVDSAVVETTIHHPTDSRLVGDGRPLGVQQRAGDDQRLDVAGRRPRLLGEEGGEGLRGVGDDLPLPRLERGAAGHEAGRRRDDLGDRLRGQPVGVLVHEPAAGGHRASPGARARTASTRSASMVCGWL